MGKRLVRIRSEEISARIGQLTGREVDLVLHSRQTLHGRLLETTAPAVVLRDHIGHRHTVALADIEEIIYDQPAPY